MCWKLQLVVNLLTKSIQQMHYGKFVSLSIAKEYLSAYVYMCLKAIRMRSLVGSTEIMSVWVVVTVRLKGCCPDSVCGCGVGGIPTAVHSLSFTNIRNRLRRKVNGPRCYCLTLLDDNRFSPHVIKQHSKILCLENERNAELLKAIC